jgi:Serine-pyruvate aminotransferase/archaeal aspartate aminotransferase
MISFYPGPSKVHEEIPRYVKDAYRKGILSLNHRSQEFESISKRTVELLKKKLRIPKGYTIFFAGSATECWEMIAQSLIVTKSTHVYNGAFGEKWYDYTKRLKKDSESVTFRLDEPLKVSELVFPDSEVICITQNETSNGTQVSGDIIQKVKENNPQSLIAVDATSSMGGITLEFSFADIWFASVQKCFGLPAGLGLMICSPNAIERIKSVGERNHYNSLSFVNAMMEKWQTPFTPNVLGIYLLMRIMKKSDPIKAVNKKTIGRYKQWISFFEKHPTLKLLTTNPNIQSYTVLPVTGDPILLEKIKKSAKKSGILLGEGYGDLRKNTFRIANFPAIKKKEISALMSFLKKY